MLASVASAQTTVPDLKGKPLDTVRQMIRLQDVSFCEGIFYIAGKHWRDDIRPNVVYMQTPRPGTVIPSQATIACWTFRKATPEMEAVRMPDLRNLAPSEVAEKLTRYRMPIMRGSKTSATTEGVVVDQYPRPNQPTYMGASVFLILRDQ